MSNAILFSDKTEKNKFVWPSRSIVGISSFHCRSPLSPEFISISAAELYSYLRLFVLFFLDLFAQKANKEIAHFVPRDTVLNIYSSLLTNASPHLFFFFHKVVSFYKGFHQTFLIKLSVFVRFDERYCEHSTRKDIKARFALRNTNGFREFSPMRSYRLSRNDGERRRSNSTRLCSSI